MCGASTNGLVGTHLIPACHDYGISDVRAANLLAMMGIFDIVGTTASGWLTDRFSSRYLLFAYYSLRGLSLLFLPHTLMHGGSTLNWFAIFYGLDWIATVPPTVRLTADAFGRENTGVNLRLDRRVTPTGSFSRRTPGRHATYRFRRLRARILGGRSRVCCYRMGFCCFRERARQEGRYSGSAARPGLANRF